MLDTPLAAVPAKVLLFGRLAEALGASHQFDIPAAGCTVGELRRRLAGEDPQAQALLLRPDVRAALDQVIVRDSARVWPGAEVAFLPIFSGG